jgi:imidazolonepropionase-like amidohydrolase
MRGRWNEPAHSNAFILTGRTQMARTLFKNVSIFDGSGNASFLGEVMVQGNRIQSVAKGIDQIAADGAEVVDGGGATLMPGLTEAHAHISYTNCVQLKDMGNVPVEEHMLITTYNAKLMLDSGFTSAFSAASSKLRMDIVLRNEINAGRVPGPRLRAASPEITATGGLGDERQAHMHHTGIEIIADGADEVRRATRMMIREGVDTIKVNISGDNFVRPNFSEALAYTDAEVAAAAEQAKEWGVWLACHARANAAVKMALRHGFRVIYHCDFADEEALDMLEAKKDEIFVAPAIGVVYTTAYEAGAWGITKDVAEKMGMFASLERSCAVYKKMRKRGIRVLPGGDYGFAWNPIGTNARDFEHFVNLFGYTPAETLMAATKLGGEIMGMGDELGLVKEGYLADLIMVDGDPVKDVTLFQDRDNLLMIMKDGSYHKVPLPRRSSAARVAAE